jgi:hypothetical protein
MKAKTFKNWLTESYDEEPLRAAAHFGNGAVTTKVFPYLVPLLELEWDKIKYQEADDYPTAAKVELEYLRATLLPDGEVNTKPVVKVWNQTGGWERYTHHHLRQFDWENLADSIKTDIAISLKIEAIEKAAQYSEDLTILAEIAEDLNFWRSEALLKNKNLPTNIVMDIYYNTNLNVETREKAKAHPNFGDTTEWALGDW